MRRTPINTDADGDAKTIPAGYYKFRFRNLTRRMGGARDGFAATGVLEEYEDDDTDEH